MRRQGDDARTSARKAAQRKALRALARARRAADRAGVSLSDWEDAFLGSVTERIGAYGRAFADPEKGGPGQALSAMQAKKLKEIAAKAAGAPKTVAPRPGAGRDRNDGMDGEPE